MPTDEHKDQPPTPQPAESDALELNAETTRELDAPNSAEVRGGRRANANEEYTNGPYPSCLA